MAGPYLAMAVLCEKVLREGDGTLSVIRVVDRVTHVAQGAEVPQEMPPAPISLQLLISLRRGDARGRHSMVLRVEEPSGIQSPAATIPVIFEGSEESAAVTGINFNFVAQSEGLYWIDVLFGADERLLTRIPLRVLYVPQQTAATG